MVKTRKTNSKEKLQAALVALLTERDFHQITVSALAQRAGVNRGTFYLNYLDRDDLLAQTQQDFFDGLAAVMRRDQGIDQATQSTIFAEQTIQDIAEYLRDHYQLVRAFLTSSIQAEVTERILQLLKGSFASRQAEQPAPAIPMPYATEVIFSSIINIFSLWITRGMVESIPELVVIIRRYRSLTPNEIMRGIGK